MRLLRPAGLVPFLGLALLTAPAAAPAATPWTGLTPLSTAATAGSAPGTLGDTTPGALAVSPSGRAVAAWVSGTVVHVARRAPDGAWTPTAEVTTASTPANTNALDLAIDAAGDATVVWSTSGGVRSATSTAGGPFGASAIVSGASAITIDLAMNASGRTVAVMGDGQGSTATVTAVSAPSAGGAWTAPVLVSRPSDPNLFTFYPRVAINAGGEAVATFSEIALTSPGGVSTYTYRYLAALKPAAGAWPASSPATVAVLGTAPGTPLVPAPPAIDDAGRVTVPFRTATEVSVALRSPGSPTFQADPQVLTGGCGNPTTDTSVLIALDGGGARTIAYPCSGQVRVVTRDADQTLAGSGATASLVASVAAAPALALDVTADGKALLVVSDSTTRAFRRLPTQTNFAAGEPLVEPEPSPVAAVQGAGQDTAGDAVALTGQTTGGGPMTPATIAESAVILDLTAPAAGIAGPSTGQTGQALTFTATNTDPFGGLVGAPAWTVAGAAPAADSGPSITRTFAAPGVYDVTVAQGDVGGRTGTASRSVTITSPAPAPTPTTPTVTTTSTTPTTPATPTIPSRPPVAATCRVPKVTGLTLAAATKALKKARCALGKVTRPKLRRVRGKVVKVTLRVSRQGPAAKRVVPSGTKVKLTLKEVTPKKRQPARRG